MPEQIFGPDSRAAAVRNAGGRATKDAINSMTVLRTLAGLSLILVVHHTGNSRLLQIVERELFKRAFTFY